MSRAEEEVFHLEKYRGKTKNMAPLSRCEVESNLGQNQCQSQSVDNVNHIQRQIDLLEKLKHDGLQCLVPNNRRTSPALMSNSITADSLSNVKIDVHKSPDLRL